MAYKSHAIPGFKVMDWLEKAREEDYRLQRENPEQFAKELEDAYQRITSLNRGKQCKLNAKKQRELSAIAMSKLTEWSMPVPETKNPKLAAAMKQHKSHTIPGFKVMDWLRKVREELSELALENPEQFAKELEDAHQRSLDRIATEKRKQLECS